MPELFDRLNRKKEKDIIVLAGFVSIFCREKHPENNRSTFTLPDSRLEVILGSKDIRLCPDCRKLLSHGIAKLLQCTYDPKPMCKKCPTRCYAPGYRERIREVMRFSGLYLVKHGRLDLIWHYFF
jgi:hypothetical protein